ncbi:MAG TPA: TldD/PmbA family protein [Firmicutes bacterium]|nr:TldD/PmbA family protein [Candidatus Fermentithermobacillaceae bacterium]
MDVRISNAERVELLGRQKALEIVDKAIRHSPGDLTEVIIRGGVSRLTRFTENYIHQNVSEVNQGISVKVIFGKKIGVASTNSLDEQSLREAVENAARIAKLQKPNEDFEGIPEPEDVPEVDAFSENTYAFSAMDRAHAVKAVIDKAKSKGFKAAGAFSTDAGELCVANSLGIRAYFPSTTASLSTVVMSETSSGYASARATDVAEISAGEVGRKAAEKCAMGENPVSIGAGEYEVILEPLAVVDMLTYLAWMGFSAQAVRDGRSFVSGKLGQKLFSDRFTFWDDGLDKRGFPMPFDLEGVPKSKVVMVENGVASELVYDIKNARKEGRKSTGHGGFGGWGPMAVNLFMAGGSDSVEDMIKKTGRGILVTRFHYTNPAHPIKMLITGMTRDGTFLIEDGKITRPVKNLRFTESALRVFGTMDMVGKDMVRAGRTVAPAIRVPAFTFTGTTEF